MTRRAAGLIVSSVVAAAMLAASPAAAQTDTIDKPVTIYVAGTAGGGIACRQIAAPANQGSPS